MNRFRSSATLIAALVITVSTGSAQQQPFIDMAGFALSVRELRVTDSVVTRYGVLRSAPGNHLVGATLVGQALESGWLLATPDLFAAQLTHTIAGREVRRIVSARAFKVFAAGEANAHWIVRSTTDLHDQPILHATVRPGDLRVLVLFEVPSSVTSLRVIIPTVAGGTTTIGTP